jgi:hypothetical protein
MTVIDWPSGNDRHRLALGPDAAAVDPRLAVFDGEVVDQEAGGEVVGAINDRVHVAGELGDITVRNVGDDGFDFNFRVDAAEFVGGGDSFWQTVGNVLLVVEYLALQVIKLDEIAIHDSHEANARANERFGNHRTERAAAADKRARSSQPLLATFAERGEAGLAIIPRWGGVIHLMRNLAVSRCRGRNRQAGAVQGAGCRSFHDTRRQGGRRRGLRR